MAGNAERVRRKLRLAAQAVTKDAPKLLDVFQDVVDSLSGLKLEGRPAAHEAIAIVQDRDLGAMTFDGMLPPTATLERAARSVTLKAVREWTREGGSWPV